MLNRRLLERVLLRAMSGGADFVEIFAERSHSSAINYVDSKIESIYDNTISGVGIRAFLGVRTVYASTTDITEEGLMLCAASVAEAIGEGRAEQNIVLSERIAPNIHPVRIVPSDSLTGFAADLLKAGCQATAGYDKRIIQVQGQLMTKDRNILIANSEGLYITDRSVRTRIAISAVASDGTENQTGSAAPGAHMGLEFFEECMPEEVGRRAAEQAITNLEAVYCRAGKMTVAIEGGFGGVLFHEACGHSLEATSVAIGASQMAGKLGQKIANEKVTVVDDGTIPNGWGSMNIDDEGNPARRNVLIENGVLKSYMIDRLGSRRMGLPVTGNSRRENYSFEPTSRMTNTFILNGPDRNEDIIASIEYGLYAKEMGGGSVNPLTGAFNFSVREGYMIRNGRICEAVRGASLIGTGSQILENIDMVGQNQACGEGMCGSRSGSVPVGVGQPLIRVTGLTVGGR
ncbi:MAG: TldD/PmbA family protein [Eubacteriales bacterium]|jgi:TldD protein